MFLLTDLFPQYQEKVEANACSIYVVCVRRHWRCDGVSLAVEGAGM